MLVCVWSANSVHSGRGTLIDAIFACSSLQYLVVVNDLYVVWASPFLNTKQIRQRAFTVIAHWPLRSPLSLYRIRYLISSVSVRPPLQQPDKAEREGRPGFSSLR